MNRTLVVTCAWLLAGCGEDVSEEPFSVVERGRLSRDLGASGTQLQPVVLTTSDNSAYLVAWSKLALDGSITATRVNSSGTLLDSPPLAIADDEGLDETWPTGATSTLGGADTYHLAWSVELSGKYRTRRRTASPSDGALGTHVVMDYWLDSGMFEGAVYPDLACSGNNCLLAQLVLADNGDCVVEVWQFDGDSESSGDAVYAIGMDRCDTGARIAMASATSAVVAYRKASGAVAWTYLDVTGGSITAVSVGSAGSNAGAAFDVQPGASNYLVS